jgi:ABC-type nitrate/sulfonate/bicarbonate transport system substrate-binding protein
MSTIDRRRFLRLGVGAAGMSLLAACGGQAAPSAAPSTAPASAKPVGSAAPASGGSTSSATPAASVSAKPAASGAASPAASGKPAASPAASSAPASAAPGTTLVRIATVGSISDAGFYLADDRGYMKEMGLTADFQRLQSGPQMVPLLATGQLDVAGGSVSGALFSAIQRDIPLRIVADKGSNQPGFTFSYVLVRKDLVDSGQFKGWADLKGKKVAISSTDNSAEVFVDHVMRSVGLSIKDVDNPIDAGQTIEPFATQYVEKGFAVIPPDKETIYKGFQAAVVMYGPKFIADKPDVGKRLMVAYLRGVRDYNVAFTKGTNKDAVIQSLINHTSVKDRALYDKMGLPGLNPDGPPNDQDLAGQQDFFLARGYQKEKLDLKPVLDHSFTEYAVGQLGKFSA